MTPKTLCKYQKKLHKCICLIFHILRYEWISDAVLIETKTIGDDEDNFNKTKQKIDEKIQKLLKSTEPMQFETEVKVSFTVAQFIIFL